MRRVVRLGTYPVVAALVGLAAVPVAPASPASAATYFSISPATWAYVDSQAPRTAFVNRDTDARVGTTVERDGRSHTYRSYFTFDLARLRGATVHQADFYTSESAVNDCDAAAPVELWRTRSVTSRTTWRNQPAELEMIRSFDRGPGSGCPGYLGADVIVAVNEALARGDASVTFELRVARANETNPALGRRLDRPGLSFATNHPPTVAELSLVEPDRPCGTAAAPSTGNDSTQFRARAVDEDESDYLTATFALWEVGHFDERRTFGGVPYGDGITIAAPDLSGYRDGALLAWTAQASDGEDPSAWARACYLRVDRTAPADAPMVGSRLYREGSEPTGGTGVAGRFRFDARGDRDVTAFQYTFGTGLYPRVAARRPGGSAVVEFTPPNDGSYTLTVWSLDAAGNRGPEAEYAFTVRDTAPWGSVDVAGVGLPSRITLQSPLPEVTAFSHQVEGAAEVRFPAVNGAGTAEVTFDRAGQYEIVVRTYAGRRMLGSGRLWAYVSDAPVVESAEFNLDRDVFVGQTGTFTFRPRSVGVVAYVVDFGDGERRVDAAPDGTATISWTAEVGRWYQIRVRSVHADGRQGETTDYQFNVIETRPSVYVRGLTDSPRRDGVGVPLQIEFTSWLPTVTGFAYRFNGGPELTVASEGDPYANVTVTPEHAGDNTVEVWAVLADGTRSPGTTYRFAVHDGPVVTQTPPGDGTVDKPMTFVFRPGLPGATVYRYSFDGADETVAAGPDGTATVTYTPTYWGYHMLRVLSVDADGNESATRLHDFNARDNKVAVFSGYDESHPRGGIGTLANFTFFTQLFGEVMEYRYHVDDEPEQTVLASTEGTSTWVRIPLNRNGLNTLYVQSRTAAGELSPVTAYRFLVGTAPLVVSAQYPDSTWGGGPGVEGTFEFSGGTAGIVSFDYRIDDGPVTTVAADEGGRASVTFTPPEQLRTFTMVVTGRLADGTTTDSTTYNIYVAAGG